MDDFDGFTVAIAGLGLMGGSLALALRERGLRVLGADADPAVVRRAQARGAIDGPWDGETADLVVLAMPVRGIVAWLRERGPSLPPGTLLMDLGSTKREIVLAMGALPVESIGGHPMCGKETSGIDSAEAGLFRGARFVLTPTARTTERALRVGRAVAAAIGAEAIVLDAATHDRAVAAISHVPYLLSVALVNTVAKSDDAHVEQLASTGYASMTRLAASDLRMMGDIVATNHAAIVDALDDYIGMLARLRDEIAAGDEAAWRAELDTARRHKTSER